MCTGTVRRQEASTESHDIVGSLWICLPSRSHCALLWLYRNRIGGRVQGCVEYFPSLKVQGPNAVKRRSNFRFSVDDVLFLETIVHLYSCTRHTFVVSIWVSWRLSLFPRNVRGFYTTYAERHDNLASFSS
jgi:hypothetical protein